MTTHSIPDQLRLRFGDSVKIGVDCNIAPEVIIEIDRDGMLVLGDRVSIRRGTTIQVHRGATVVIGSDVAIGENTFLSAMIGIRIGNGVGISNMVDMHDHNHRDRSFGQLAGEAPPTPWASGFAGAPIIIESGAIISNKASITAGARIGQNTIVGANSTVSRSIGPNTVAVGSPAGAKRSFDAHLSNSETRFEVAFAWFGTSIMQHLEGFNAQMITQSDLPAVGSTVLVESWKIRGYVQRLHTTLQTRWPFLDITFHNYGEGGATSRDILRIVRSNTTPPNPAFAVSILACGINDVWRGFQGRHAEAIDLTEFTDNYRSILEILTATSRQVICIAETPFGWDDTIDVTAANAALRQYNIAAAQIAAAAGSAYIDVWPAFNAAARQLSGNADLSLWSDGVHLSEYGDALLHELVDFRLRTDGTIERMTSYALYDRDRALQLYGSLFEDIRSSKPKQPNVP